MFASQNSRNHMALVVATTRSAAENVDEDAIFRSFALD
jgi:hypothetical protein